MKSLVAALLVTLALTTGFTCSKNTSTEVNKTEVAPPPVQDQMGAPAPAEGAAPVAPATGEAAPAAPATEPVAPPPGH